MRKVSLGTLGAVCIFSAALVNAFSGRPQTREEAIGSGFASLLMILVGAALIIAHFLQRKRQ